MSSVKHPRSQSGYDQLAPVYSAVEWLAFGKRLQTARTALIKELPAWNRLLILGDGDGRLLEQLCLTTQRRMSGSVHPQQRATITSVDHSRAMLRSQRARVEALGSTASVQFVHCDALEFRPEAGAYDVVVTPFFLDCFSKSELEEQLPHWLSALSASGQLYHVDFFVPRSMWQRPRAAILLRLMHQFFGWQTGLKNRQLVELSPLFEQHQLTKVAESIGGWGMIATQIWLRKSPA